MRSQITSKIEDKVCVFIVEGLGEIMGTPIIHNSEFYGIKKPRALRTVTIDKTKPVPKNAVQVSGDKAVVSLVMLGNPEELFLPGEVIMSVCGDERLTSAYQYSVTGILIAEPVQIQEVKRTKVE